MILALPLTSDVGQVSNLSQLPFQKMELELVSLPLSVSLSQRVVVRILKVNIYKMAYGAMPCVLVTQSWLLSLLPWLFSHVVVCGSDEMIQVTCSAWCLEHTGSPVPLGIGVLSSLLSLSLKEPLDLNKGVHIAVVPGTFLKISCPHRFLTHCV